MAIQVVHQVEPLTVHPPLALSFNDRIRPLLDAVDELRRLGIMREGIQLPTIVVVGDQSSGKSSVLESLAGIRLPIGQGICTRVPLVMRLQSQQGPEPEFLLQYGDQEMATDESSITEAIDFATNEIVGSNKGISKSHLTLVVKKRGVPDLTMVDLPGITRVAGSGQAEDISEQIAEIIMEHIRPEESIILNVLPATHDFATCESISMSQRVDKLGQRTLAVVTKVDMLPDGLYEKVTGNEVNIGLGYVCVRNRIGSETYEQAREEERRLFQTHPLLSRIDKGIVGIPVLAQKLVEIQAASIAKCLPGIVKSINDKLVASQTELHNMPKNLSSEAEATKAFTMILVSAKESLQNLLVRGEFGEYPEEKHMHSTTRLAEMLDQFADKLHKCRDDKHDCGSFLVDEVEVLSESKGITLPNFIPRAAFLSLLRKRVEEVSATPVEYVTKMWDYVESVVVTVFKRHSAAYPQLQMATIRGAQNVTMRMRAKSIERVRELVEMEKLSDYTCNPEYMSKCNALMAQQNNVIASIFDRSQATRIEGLGTFGISHLKNLFNESSLRAAYELKMRVVAYWEVVLQRLTDSLALHLLFSVQNLVNTELVEVVGELASGQGGGMFKLLEESSTVAEKREKLAKSIELLEESKEVMSRIMNQIHTSG